MAFISITIDDRAGSNTSANGIITDEETMAHVLAVHKALTVQAAAAPAAVDGPPA